LAAAGRRTATIALAGDTMLGRAVGRRLASGTRFDALFDPAVRRLTAAADACLVNLECCVSLRGTPWPAPGKPFFFRAPPRAVDALRWLGVGCVSLANNHALDYGPDALLDTLDYLADAGIEAVGAGATAQAARSWRAVVAGDLLLGVLGVTDHPADFAATSERPGVAFADLRRGLPDWLTAQISDMAARVDVAIITVHWGPNMTDAPVAHVRAAAPALLDAGATVVVGHSAHVFHGVAGPVLYDLGDFIDDYRPDPVLRNDLGLLFLLEVDEHGAVAMEAVPLALDFCHTRPASPAEARWLRRRFSEACEALGTPVDRAGERLRVRLR
jgi:poly-gamma-glutamate synthesis protein (capsule biosynthesis protein)